MKRTIKIFFLLFFIVLIAYGQTLRMYFWIDDNALIYKLQHIEEGLGFWGAGAAGAGPYRHIVDQFVPFYPIFKTSPMPYFLIGILLYFFASVTVYYFVKILSNDKKLAFYTSLIFASGYVASETIFGIVNSWQTSRGIIMALVTFMIYLKFIRGRSSLPKVLVFYMLSVGLFYLSLDTVYIRAHGLIFAIVFFDILFWPVKFKLKSITGSFIRLVPFAFIHYEIYLKQSANYVREFPIFKILTNIISEKKYELVSIPLQDIGNLFVPDKFNLLVDKIISQSFHYPKSLSIGSTIAGIFIICVSLVLIKKYFKKGSLSLRVFLFSLVWALANFIVFYLREPLHTLWTTHRYFSYSFVGVALFYGLSTIEFQKRHKLARLIPILLIFTFFWLGIAKQYQFNKDRSLPAKAFFQMFNQSVPELKKGDVLYFDIANENEVAGQFGSFFGGMFSEASNFAIYTPGIDYMNDFLFTYDFNEVLGLLVKKDLKLENLYAFYYGRGGLVDISEKVRKTLKSGNVVDIEKIKVGDKIEITPPENTPSLVTSKLSFLLKVNVVMPKIPYETKDKYTITQDQKKRIFSYLSSRRQYHQNSAASSASYWKDQTGNLAMDGRLDTAWRASRGYWEEYVQGREEQKEYFQVDLGRTRNIGAIRFFSAQRPLIPTEYEIFVSNDSKNFRSVKVVRRVDEFPEGTEIVDSFEPTNARYVRMEVAKTLGNDGPEVKEFEVIDSDFVGLDGALVKKVENYPFAEIRSVEEFNLAKDYVQANTSLKVFWKSDADTKWNSSNYLEMPLIADGQFHSYEVELPATGLAWQKFLLEGINFPAGIEIESVKIIYTSI